MGNDRLMTLAFNRADRTRADRERIAALNRGDRHAAAWWASEVVRLDAEFNRLKKCS